MEPRKHDKHFSISEALLPLFFFAGTSLLYAAVLIPFIAGITLLLFEALRRQPRAALSAIYLLWLAVCGGLGWFVAAIPPYWVWCVYLLIPETAWAPSDAQQARPFLFGLKKYFNRRILELLRALIFFSACAGGIFLFRQKFYGAAYWVTAIFALLAFEILFGVVRDKATRRKK